MKQTSTTKEDKGVDDLLEDFDEKAKLSSQIEDDEDDRLESEKEDELIKEKDDTKDKIPRVSTPIHTEEMDHIFNQFNEETSTTTTSTTTEMRRPSLNSNELQIVPDTPPQQEIPFDFNRFLEQMRSRNSKPITRYFKSFLQAFDRRPWTVNEQIKIIQDFLDFIFVKMRECDIWKDMSEQEFGNAKEGMEKLVMNRLYHVTFCPNTTDDKERDEILYQKISIFRWIREKHLDIPETEHNESFLSFAESEILKINNYKAPRDKLICILNCCKVIFGLIKHVEGDAGADKFLPILIYVVIRANPPKLVSNVQNPEQLQAEAGYYLTNLMGAISFIETMEANSLSITKEEFDSNIERTMTELQHERPSVALDKQQINYENALHPSRSSSTRPQVQPLLDPAKAAALLERGSQFAQKTMQRPLSFVGKIFQGLSDTSATSSRAESPDEEERYHQQQQQFYQQQQQYYYQQQQQQLQQDQQQQQQQQPPLPPRPHPDQIIMQQRQQFDANLETLNSMFTNVDNSVCYLILHANGGDLSKSIDHLLDISGDQGTITTNDPQYTTQSTPTESFANIQPTPTGVPSKDTH